VSTVASKAGLAPLGRSGFRIFLLCVLLIGLCGCAGRLNKAAEQFYADQPEAALSLLERGDWFGKRNQLLFQMERGAVLHQLGRYRESSEVLLQAAAQIEEFERLSLSEQLGSLVTSEWLLRYKGEYSERLWVHTYQMMNFLLLGEYESAYVEARQALEIYLRYPQALKSDYFTRGLMALSFANVGEDNDANLVYLRLAEDLPSMTPVAADLVQLGNRLGLIDEVKRFEASLPQPLPEGDGELVLFIATGRIPKKRPGNVVVPPSIRFSFPYYPDSRIAAVQTRLLPAHPQLPQLSTDLAAIAAQSLEQRKVAIIAKETARVAAKEAISQNVGNEHGRAAEAVVRVSLFLLEEPDTRCWQTLPGRLTLVRVPLPAGQHSLRLRLSGGGLFSAPEIALPTFQLRPGQRFFYSLRL